MRRTCRFFGEGRVGFEDSRSVGELLCHAFEVFGLEERLAISSLTLRLQ